MNTPWGPSHHTEQITPGIVFHSTAGHGGFHISPSLLATMPESWRRPGGWYEEDVEATLVILAFPRHFTPQQQESALQSAKNWYPDELRAAGITVTEEDSHVLRERAFIARHAHDFVVVSAWGSWHKDVPDGMVGVLARKNATGEEAFFLVPKDEYTAGHFLINLARHQPSPSLR